MRPATQLAVCPPIHSHARARRRCRREPCILTQRIVSGDRYRPASMDVISMGRWFVLEGECCRSSEASRETSSVWRVLVRAQDVF
jgi:hypothetical protein